MLQNLSHLWISRLSMDGLDPRSSKAARLGRPLLAVNIFIANHQTDSDAVHLRRRILETCSDR